MNVLVAGATGAIGRPLISALVSARRRFLALAVDSYDLVLRQKPQHPDIRFGEAVIFSQKCQSH
jgi:nucleoside-diphosphate-sugar epimerase